MSAVKVLKAVDEIASPGTAVVPGGREWIPLLLRGIHVSMTLVEKIVIATAIGLLTTILVFINHAVWAVGEMLDWRYVIGFATGMTLTILWFRFVRRLD